MPAEAPQWGVAAIIEHSTDNRIFVVQEEQEKRKIGKFRGMDSTPMETGEFGESLPTAIERLRQQEYGGLPFEILYCVGEYGIAHATATLFVARALTPCLPVFGEAHGELSNPRWMTPQDACGLWLRQGALEMIEDYIAGRRNVVRESTRKPQFLVRT